MAKPSDRRNLSYLEKSIIKVAGDSSKKWHINDLHKAVIEKGVKQFGDDPNHLANFLRRRPHLFDFQNDKVSTKFNNEEIKRLSAKKDNFKSMPDVEVVFVNLEVNDQYHMYCAKEIQRLKRLNSKLGQESLTLKYLVLVLVIYIFFLWWIP